MVGRAAFPVTDERSAVGRGVLLSKEEIESVARPDTFNHDLVIDWADGVDVDRKAATLSEEAGVEVTAPRLPSDVNNLKEVEVLPRTLAILLALLALLVLLHALVATTRARQRDLAVLRTLGFERRHLSATVAWQATAIALLGVLLGGVIGIGVGRLVWTAIARNIGVVEDPTMPVGLLALMAVVARGRGDRGRHDPRSLGAPGEAGDDPARRLSRRRISRSPGDDVELVALGIGEGGPGGAGLGVVGEVGGAERQETGDLGGEVIGGEVRMDPVLAGFGLWDLEEHPAGLAGEHRVLGGGVVADGLVEHGGPEGRQLLGVGAVEGEVGQLWWSCRPPSGLPSREGQGRSVSW